MRFNTIFLSFGGGLLFWATLYITIQMQINKNM